MVFRRLSMKFLLSCMLALVHGDQGHQPIEGEKYFPKNIIILLGSGMSFEAVTTARVELAKIMQNGSSSNPHHLLPFEALPSHGVLMTYANDFSPGNGESGTRKIFNGPTQRNSNSCEDTRAIYPSNIISLAQNVGKSTGLVTTLRVTSEIPPAIFGHEAMYEGSKCSNTTISNCSGAFRQIIHGKTEGKMNVIFGKSHNTWDVGQKSGKEIKGCSLMDQEKMLEEWREGRSERVLISSISHLKNVTVEGGKQALGMFPEIYMDDFKIMIARAIEILKDNEKGYFLAVIIKKRNVVETVKMVSKLIPIIRKSASQETLFVVTSDYAELVGKCDVGCLSSQEIIRNWNITNKQEVVDDNTSNSPPKKNLNQANNFTTRKFNFTKYHYDPNDIQKSPHKHNKLTHAKLFPKKPVKTSTEKSINVTKEKEISIKTSEGHSKSTTFQVSNITDTLSQATQQTKGTISQETRKEDNVTMPSLVNFSMTKTSTEYVENDIQTVSIANHQKEVAQTNSVTTESSLITTNPVTYKTTAFKENRISSPHPTDLYAMTENYAVTTEQIMELLANEISTDVSEDNVTQATFETDSREDDDSSTESVVNDDFGSKTAFPLHERRKRWVIPKTVFLDVPIYASGPMSNLIRGVNKQEFLWKVMTKSVCTSIESINSTNCGEDVIVRDVLGIFLGVNKSLSNEFADSGAGWKWKYAASWISIIFIFFSL